MSDIHILRIELSNDDADKIGQLIKAMRVESASAALLKAATISLEIEEYLRDYQMKLFTAVVGDEWDIESIDQLLAFMRMRKSY
jgi:hypothetical protein